MVSKPLLFYDSGAGGLPYLAAARARLPAERIIYVADRKNFPLGDKTAKRIRKLVLETISLAVDSFDPCLVVIACNTASVVALQTLRQHFPIPFVGVVPAVKPAALSLTGGKLAVVATRQTASGAYLERLIREFADRREVLKVPVTDLVDFAEYRYLSADPQERLAAVRTALAPLIRQEVVAVVLGCTHFVLLEQEFRAVLTDRVALIDSREGVTQRIISLLSSRGAEPADPRNRQDGYELSPESGQKQCSFAVALAKRARLYLNGGVEEAERYRAFARRFGLSYCGLLEEAGP